MPTATRLRCRRSLGLADALPHRLGGAILVAVAVYTAAGGAPALATGLEASGSQLFFETSDNPIHPPAIGDELGWAVAVGDFDGDGSDDLAIGLRNDDNPFAGLSDIGQVQIRFGISGVGLQGGVNVKYVWQGGLSTVDDPEPGDHFGQSLVAGDFDDDGFDDLAIGIPGEDVGTISNAGAVEVRYGASNRSAALDTRRQLFHQNVAGVPDSAAVDDEFGYALAAGDFDADTFDDLAIGVPGDTDEGVDDAGRVIVLYGAVTGVATAGVQNVDVGMWGVSPGGPNRMGASLAVGDFNNDGPSDLAIGLPNSSARRGLVYEAKGSFSGLQPGHALPQGSGGIFDQPEPGDDFGYSLASGHFNDDPFWDLAVGVPGEGVPNGASEIARAGGVHVLYGKATGLDGLGSQFWISGDSEAGDEFGRSVAAGDFDGDGFDELAIGVPFEERFRGPEEGNVVVLRGSADGTLGSGHTEWNLEVPGILGDMNPGDHLGWCLAVGDFDSDAAEDLVIGIPNDGNIGGALALHGRRPFAGFYDSFELGNLTLWSAHTP
jgi:hypothetical protein